MYESIFQERAWPPRVGELKASSEFVKIFWISNFILCWFFISFFIIPQKTFAYTSPFVPSISNPIIIPGASDQNAVQEPSVIYDNGIYKMIYRAGWYTTNIDLATSQMVSIGLSIQVIQLLV